MAKKTSWPQFRVLLVAGLCLVSVGRAALATDESAASPLRTIPDPLTLEEALTLFHEHGFDLLLADLAVASARGDLQAAAAFQNPIVSGAGGHTFHYDPGHCPDGGCSATAFNVNLSDQGVVLDLLIGKRRLRAQVAAAALEAARLSRADAERVLVPAVKQQFTQVVLASAALDFAHQAADMARQTEQLVQAQFNSGAASEADVARAQVAEMDAERSADSAAENLAIGKAALASLLGVRGPIDDFHTTDVPPPFVVPEALRDASANTLRVLALDHRPDLAAARAQVEGAQAARDLARRQRIPDISLVANYQQEGTGQGAIQPPTATFGLSLPLPVFYQGQGEILKAESELTARDIAVQKLTAQVGADVGEAFASFESARSRVQRMESRLLQSARRARDLVAYRHRKGAASLFEYLDAQRSFVTTQTDYYQDLGDYWTALSKLEEAVGMELQP